MLVSRVVALVGFVVAASSAGVLARVGGGWHCAWGYGVVFWAVVQCFGWGAVVAVAVVVARSSSL